MLHQTIHIHSPTRRLFLSRATSGIAALGLFGGVRREVLAQLVWKTSDWKLADFQKLVNDPARIKHFEEEAPKVLELWNKTHDWSHRASVFGAAHGYKRA